MPPKSRLYLIDGSSQMYRAYHAIRHLTGPDGKSTNAVYGFVAMLRKLINEHRPELLAVAFDVAGPTFRSELAADYKATRAPMPADLVEQVPWIHEACDALGVPVLTAERYEADDVIGTIAEQAVAAGHTVAIVTGTRISSSLSATRSPCSTRETRGRGTTPTASQPSSGSHPIRSSTCLRSWVMRSTTSRASRHRRESGP